MDDLFGQNVIIQPIGDYRAERAVIVGVLTRFKVIVRVLGTGLFQTCLVADLIFTNLDKDYGQNQATRGTVRQAVRDECAVRQTLHLRNSATARATCQPGNKGLGPADAS